MDQIEGDGLKGRSISIGVFAHNEENNILTTLESLAAQDIFQLPLFSSLNITVSVLANGCTDTTVPIATNYLKSQSSFKGQVVEIKRPAKAMPGISSFTARNLRMSTTLSASTRILNLAVAPYYQP